MNIPIGTISNILDILEYDPLFNKRKGEMIYSYREIFTIKNKDDFEFLKNKYTMKFD